MKQFLIEILRARVSEEGWMWFEKALQSASAPVQANKLMGSYTAASRKLGKHALLLNDLEKKDLHSLNPELPLDHWGIDEAARALLLLSLSHLSPDEYVELVLQCYEYGDSREQQSWLRALSLLPHCEQFLETAMDACRTNIIPLFESIACENPYPSHYFPELNFNHMVLKSLFNGVAVTRIMGLESRFNQELSRMADDYVSEREAAGREVPPDIWLALAPRIPQERLARVHSYLRHESPNHRYWAAVGLGHTYDAASRSELEKQRKIEAEQNVIGAMDASLAKMVQ